MRMPFFSIVSPVYRAEGLISELVRRISSAVGAITLDYEIILVEDGSPDASWAEIAASCRADSKVKGVKLSRNFGQHAAITAGLSYAKGEWIVVMDCDLQDRPEEIPRLYQAAQEKAADIVLARRYQRQDSFLKRLSSKLFYRTLSYLTDTQQDESIGNFGIYHRRVIQAILEMGDHVRYFPVMVRWVGFDTHYLDVQHAAREIGKSSYTLWKLIKLALTNFIAFSDKLLMLTINLGLSITLFALFFGLYQLYKYINGEVLVLGYASIIVSIWFLAGMTILVIGVTGLYVGKIYEKVKERPIFISSKTLNTET